MVKLMSRFCLWLAVFALATLGAKLVPQAQAAFGISPPFLNADHLVPGSVYVQTIYLVQDQPNEDLNMAAKLDIKEPARSWITIDKGFNFVIPKGVRQFPVDVKISVPKDASLGAYSGTLTFTTVPAKTGQVTIALGVQVAINMTVGTGIFEKFSVPVIQFPDIEEGWNPLVYIKFNNEGNIPESFDGATFELLDQYGGVRLAYVEKKGDFPETPPFSVREYTIEFPISFHLGIGEYWGVVNLYKNGKVVASQRTVFQVLKAGSLSGPWARTINYIKNNWIYYAAGIIIFVVALLVLKRRRRAGR
jgi:hypothetical protein